jgi:phosphatidylglycerophosphatase A
MLVSGFYSGFTRYAPGTIGTLLLVVIVLTIKWTTGYTFPQTHLIVMVVVLFFTSIIAIDNYLKLNENKIRATKTDQKLELDPQEIVIDEWIGMLTAMTLNFADNNQNLLSLAVLFLLFRIFDTTKWGPIKSAENYPGALGIILDDVLAGIFAGISFNICTYFIPF